jgi:hypothetical protein
MKVRPVHPAADLFPMMSADELAELAADIKANGLLYPIVLDGKDVLIDGRNRLRACEMAGVEPQFTTFEGDDPRAFIIASNINRRHLTKGQQAMAVAMMYPEADAVHRGKKSRDAKLIETMSFSSQRLSHARTVLAWASDKAALVLTGDEPLDIAYKAALERKKNAESVETQSQRLRDGAPDLADLVAEQRMTLDEAVAAFNQRIETQRREKRSRQETSIRMIEYASRGVAAWASREFVEGLTEDLKEREFLVLVKAALRATNDVLMEEFVSGARALYEFLSQQRELEK